MCCAKSPAYYCYSVEVENNARVINHVWKAVIWSRLLLLLLFRVVCGDNCDKTNSSSSSRHSAGWEGDPIRPWFVVLRACHDENKGILRLICSFCRNANDRNNKIQLRANLGICQVLITSWQMPHYTRGLRTCTSCGSSLLGRKTSRVTIYGNYNVGQ